MNDKKADTLIAKLNDTNLREREEARRALGAIGPPAVSALIQAVKSKHKNWDIAYEATKILGEIGSPAVPALIETYADEGEDWGVRFNTNMALVQIGSPAVPALLEVLEGGNPGWSVRCMIARTLEKIGDPQSVPALIKHLADFSESQTAAKTLKRIDSLPLPDLIKGLKSKNADYVVRYGVVHALVRIGPPAVPALIEMFSDSDEKMVVRRKAAETLGKIAEHHPDLVLRTALPALRRLRKRDPIFQEAFEQIEAATATFKDLPLSAGAPPPDVGTLPRPAAAADTLPDAYMTPPRGFWVRLRRKRMG